MFKFGRPYVFYDDNIVHNYAISGTTQNWFDTFRATYSISVDPAVSHDRSISRLVNIFELIGRNTDPIDIVEPFIPQPATDLQEMENLKTYWSDGSITKIGSGARAIGGAGGIGVSKQINPNVFRWDDEI